MHVGGIKIILYVILNLYRKTISVTLIGHHCRFKTYVVKKKQTDFLHPGNT